MAVRKPLVLIDGQMQELPAGDAVTGRVGAAAGAIYSGQWLTPVTNVTTANAANSVGDIRIHLWVPGQTLTIDQLAIHIVTAATGGTNAARLVIYSATAAGWPDALLATASVTGLNAVGQFGANLNTGTLTLQAGTRYWFGVHGDFTSTHRQFTAVALPHLGYASASTTPYLCIQRNVSFASGTPATWGFLASELKTFNASEIRMRVV